jgi:hypothetical protein
MRGRLAAVVGVILLAAAAAQAQPATDFSGLRAAVGDQVYVTDPATGVEVGGRITALTPSRLSIDGYSFAPIEGLKIERPGDPVWDGALIGLGLGSLIGAAACGDGRRWSCVKSAGITYGLLGAIIDFAHDGRRTIYRGGAPRTTMRLVPDIRRERKGIALAVAF